MHDPVRIDRICDLLRAYWHMNPELSFVEVVIKIIPGTLPVWTDNEIESDLRAASPLTGED